MLRVLILIITGMVFIVFGLWVHIYDYIRIEELKQMAGPVEGFPAHIKIKYETIQLELLIGTGSLIIGGVLTMVGLWLKNKS